MAEREPHRDDSDWQNGFVSGVITVFVGLFLFTVFMMLSN